LAVGAYADHKVMGARIDRMEAATAEQERLRQVQRAADERKAREKEQQWAARAGQIEEEKTNEIVRVKSDADALIARLRQQAASKPARPSPMPGASPSCPDATGGELPDRSREDFVRLAARATEQQKWLGACYKWADEVEGKATSPASTEQ
jgi:hypothetical protein